MSEIDIPYPVRKLPLIGPWASKVGNIIDIAATPCSVDPEIYVTAAFVGIPRLVWSLFKPDAYDFKYDALKGGLGNKRKRRFKAGATQDVGLPVPKNKFTTIAFKVGDIAQKIGWYFIVVDATLDYVTYWTTAVYQMSGCDFPNAARADLEIQGGGFTPTGGDWQQIAIWHVLQTTDMAAGPNGVAVDNDMQSACFVSMRVTRFSMDFPAPGGVQFRIRRAPDGVVTDTADLEPDAEGNGMVGMRARQWTSISNIYTWVVEYRIASGVASFVGSRLTVTTIKDPQVLHDP